MGKLIVIGIGPGSIDNMTLRAYRAIEDSDIIVGYNKYIDMIKELIVDKEVYSTGMMGEEARCKEALNLSKDKNVALISTGDSGIYGMAGLILEMKGEEEVEVFSKQDYKDKKGDSTRNISLSDLMTPYEEIKNRVKAAAESDFIISLYNPKSKGRPHYLKECIDIIKEFRKDTTPIAVVKHALREGQEVTMTTIGEFNDEIVDMMSIVIIGNTKSFYKNGSFITPRGYNDKKRDKIKR